MNFLITSTKLILHIAYILLGLNTCVNVWRLNSIKFVKGNTYFEVVYDAFFLFRFCITWLDALLLDKK